MNVRVSVNFAGLARFRQLVAEGVNAGVSAAAARAASHMRMGMSRGARWSSSPAGSSPNVQRGFLRNSIVSTPAVNFRAAAGSSARYAMLHEFGGAITAKSTKYLPVPVNVPARRLLERLGGRSLRSEDMKFIPGKRNKLLVGRKAVRAIRYAGGKARINMSGVPVFVLKPSVQLPARPWARPVLVNHAASIANAATAAAKARIVRGVRA